jgi:pyridoxamine 5'-phosphate oxidase
MAFPSQDPLAWFEAELQKAQQAQVPEAHAMQLATVDGEGIPSIRTVYYKGMVRGGFSFYTNYSSQKGQELIRSGRAALNFFWPALAQQVRVHGLAEKLTREESEAYFKTRARLSQIGAWASEQSQEIPGPDWLESRVQDYEKRFDGAQVPCPLDWGGFHLIPLQVEFWFGQEGRLHNRYVFERFGTESPWRMYMKSP